MNYSFMPKTLKPNKRVSVIPAELVERRILLIRGHKVMLDRDLANLYRVKPTALRQQRSAATPTGSRTIFSSN